MPPCLILVCGLPGSGKTTTATRLAADRGGIRLCADEWMDELAINVWDEAARARIENLQGNLAMELLALGTTVIIEWGMWTRSERETARDRAIALGTHVELHYLQAPVEELFRRIEARDQEHRVSDRSITLGELRLWSRLIEPPSAEELATYTSSFVTGEP